MQEKLKQNEKEKYLMILKVSHRYQGHACRIMYINTRCERVYELVMFCWNACISRSVSACLYATHHGAAWMSCL